VQVQNGILDFTHYNAEKQGIVRLQGTVPYYPSQLVTLRETSLNNLSYINLPFPGAIADHLPNHTAIGYGTYHFRIRVPDDGKTYGLNIGGIYSSYKVYINHRLEDQVGVVGTNMHAQVPLVRPEMLSLHLDPDFNDLFIQVSNFHEPQTHIGFNIEFGEMHQLYRKQQIGHGYDFSLSFLYALLALIFIVLYFIYRHITDGLFGLYCIILCFRVLVKNSKLLFEFVESGWVWLYKLEFVSYYLTAVLAPILLFTIFKIKKTKGFAALSLALALLASFITLCTQVSFFSRFTFIFHYFSACLVIITLVVTIFFYWAKPVKKYYELIAGVFIYAGCFVYDLVMSLVFYKESYYYNWGLLVLALVMATTLIRMNFFDRKIKPEL
jgi:hypothetical protein